MSQRWGEKFNKSGPTWCWGMLGAQLTKWWEDDNEDKMEGGSAEVNRCIKPCLTGLDLFFCRPLFLHWDKLWCSIIQVSCWGNVRERVQCNLSFCSNSNMCTKEGEVIHNILSALLFKISSVMQCSVVCRHTITLNVKMFVFPAGWIVQLCAASLDASER